MHLQSPIQYCEDEVLSAIFTLFVLVYASLVVFLLKFVHVCLCAHVRMSPYQRWEEHPLVFPACWWLLACYWHWKSKEHTTSSPAPPNNDLFKCVHFKLLLRKTVYWILQLDKTSFCFVYCTFCVSVKCHHEHWIRAYAPIWIKKYPTHNGLCRLNVFSKFMKLYLKKV